MKKAVMFIAEGIEEVEAVFPADILRRAGVDVKLVSITGNLEVTCSRDVKIIADELISDSIDADMLILPGGWGSAAYIDCVPLINALKQQNEKNGYIAAICAAPVTLGKLGLLEGKKATCYPGRKDDLSAGEYIDEPVVIDRNIITGRAPGASAAFGLTLAGILAGEKEAQRVKEEMYIFP